MPALKWPYEIDPALARAMGDLGLPELPLITFESSPVPALLNQRGVKSEQTEYAPRISRGEVVSTAKGDRFTVTEIVSHPTEGFIEQETQAIDIGAGDLFPVTDGAPTPADDYAAPPVTDTPAPPESQAIPAEPTFTPTSESAATTTSPTASEGGASETVPLTAAQDAYLQEQLLASGCQTEEIFDFAPDGTTFLGSHVNHFNGQFWETIEWRPV